jgi:hypothetical protein
MRKAAENTSINEQIAALMRGFHRMLGHMPQLFTRRVSEYKVLRLAAEMQIFMIRRIHRTKCARMENIWKPSSVT